MHVVQGGPKVSQPVSKTSAKTRTLEMYLLFTEFTKCSMFSAQLTAPIPFCRLAGLNLMKISVNSRLTDFWATLYPVSCHGPDREHQYVR